MNTSTNYQLIDKEAISSLIFPNEDVLNTDEEKREREEALKKALYLGNMEHGKTKIYFQDNLSLKVVETTVWGLTDKRVILKQGNVIPINRVHHVKF